MTLCIRAYGWLPTQIAEQPVGPIERAIDTQDHAPAPNRTEAGGDGGGGPLP